MSYLVNVFVYQSSKLISEQEYIAHVDTVEEAIQEARDMFGNEGRVVIRGIYPVVSRETNDVEEVINPIVMNQPKKRGRPRVNG